MDAQYSVCGLKKEILIRLFYVNEIYNLEMLLFRLRCFYYNFHYRNDRQILLGIL